MFFISTDRIPPIWASANNLVTSSNCDQLRLPTGYGSDLIVFVDAMALSLKGMMVPGE